MPHIRAQETVDSALRMSNNGVSAIGRTPRSMVSRSRPFAGGVGSTSDKACLAGMPSGPHPVRDAMAPISTRRHTRCCLVGTSATVT
jgi:hypothetical protein